MKKFKITKSKNYIALVKQIIKFCLVGVTNTCLGFAIYYVFTFIGVHYLLSNVISFIVSVLWSYFLNSKFVFRESNKGVNSVIKVYLSYGITFLLGSGILFVSVDVIGISKYIAPMINLFITTPINFILNRQWVYK